MPTFDFYFDLFSPSSYLAWVQMPVLEQAGGRLVLKPVHLQSVFRKVGTVHPLSDWRKAQWIWADLARHAAGLRVPLARSDAPLRDSTSVMAAAIKAQRHGELAPFCSCLFRAVWAAGVDPSNDDAIRSALVIAGMNGGRYVSPPDDADLAQLRANTDELVARGGFGVPSVFVEGSLYFGHDRMELVAKQLETMHAETSV